MNRAERTEKKDKAESQIEKQGRKYLKAKGKVQDRKNKRKYRKERTNRM